MNGISLPKIVCQLSLGGHHFCWWVPHSSHISKKWAKGIPSLRDRGSSSPAMYYDESGQIRAVALPGPLKFISTLRPNNRLKS